MHFKKFTKKLMLILIITAVIILILFFVGWLDFSFGKKASWGVTFSELQAQELGLNWKEAYTAILDELNPDLVRLVAYWEVIEKEKGILSYENLDWQVEQASQRNKKVLLTVGHKVPRWPECHQPNWANNLNKQELQDAVLNIVKNTIERYKNEPAIYAWQIENEALWPFFGNCPKPDKNFLKQEVALAKSIDPSRQIVVTDSGELSLWLKSSGISEILGTTMYRIVWHKSMGFIKHYYYTPLFYRLRAEIIKKLKGQQKVIVAELQAEPWASKNRSLADMPIEEQFKCFSVNDLKDNLEFARRTGLPEVYLWGVEWAYWLKTKQNNDQYWKIMQNALSKTIVK